MLLAFLFSQKVHKFYGATISKSDRTRSHLRTTANTINIYLTGHKLNLCAFCAMSNSLSWWSSVNDIVCTTSAALGLCTHNSSHDYLFSIFTSITLSQKSWFNYSDPMLAAQPATSNSKLFHIGSTLTFERQWAIYMEQKTAQLKPTLGNICLDV